MLMSALKIDRCNFYCIRHFNNLIKKNKMSCNYKRHSNACDLTANGQHTLFFLFAELLAVSLTWINLWISPFISFSPVKFNYFHNLFHLLSFIIFIIIIIYSTVVIILYNQFVFLQELFTLGQKVIGWLIVGEFLHWLKELDWGL